MAIINCPECNREISDMCESCPCCGYPLHKGEGENHQKNRTLLLVCISVFSALFVLCILLFVVFPRFRMNRESFSSNAASPTIVSTDTPVPQRTPEPSEIKTSIAATNEEIFDYLMENGQSLTGSYYSIAEQEGKAIVLDTAYGTSCSIVAYSELRPFLMFDYTQQTPNSEEKVILIPDDKEKSSFSWIYTFIDSGISSAYGTGNMETYELIVDSSSTIGREKVIPIIQEAIKMLLPSINQILQSNGFSNSYTDFGFSDAFEALVIAYPKIIPAPIEIQVSKIQYNSIGVTEAHLRFHNTGDTPIVAFGFYVECYDAYGEIVKGYGIYDVYAGNYDIGLEPNELSSDDLYWVLHGYDNTKNVKVAVSKYLLKDGETVEIPWDQLVWFS